MTQLIANRRARVALCASWMLATALLGAQGQTLIITPSTKTLTVGQTVTLTSSKPGTSWSTSDEAVATVVASGDTGVVTARGAGTAVITGKYKQYRGTSTITVTAGSIPPPTLVVACPTNVSQASPSGAPVAVTYTATTTGGKIPITITGVPASGSLFAVGTTAVTVTAKDSTVPQQTSACAFNVTVSFTSVDPTWVQVGTGDNLQTAINNNAGATTFYIKTGVHTISSAITPKTGNTFIGEPGAIIDGTGWASADTTQGAFRAWNQDIDNVTIKGLTIRNMPQTGISTIAPQPNGWLIEDNDIYACRVGVKAGNSFTFRNNKIHDNTLGGYQTYISDTVLFENNDIYANASEQKIVGSANVTFKNNHVHDNAQDGIWYDTENVGSVIEGNTVENNPRFNIHYEISGQGVIRNNHVVGGTTAIMIVVSKNVEVYGNVMTDSYRAIQYYLKCGVVGLGSPAFGGYDLANVNSHDNTVRMNTASGAWANTLGWPAADGACSASYLSGSKNLVFQHNNYYVPVLTNKYWMWGQAVYKTWTEWQALGRDTTGTVQVR